MEFKAIIDAKARQETGCAVVGVFAPLLPLLHATRLRAAMTSRQAHTAILRALTRASAR